MALGEIQLTSGPRGGLKENNFITNLSAFCLLDQKECSLFPLPSATVTRCIVNFTLVLRKYVCLEIIGTKFVANAKSTAHCWKFLKIPKIWTNMQQIPVMCKYQN